MKSSKSRPQIPGKTGGKLIRQVLRSLKSQEVALPMSSHILCAISGGADSVALAHLLIHYGKKVAPEGAISLLHINHGWRGDQSDQDQAFVEELAADWKVPLHVYRLSKRDQFIKGESPEDLARQHRKRIYQEVSESLNARIVTGHHADDVAETTLWKIFTGAPISKWGGIRFQEGVEFRPFHKVDKIDLIQYLKEEGVSYRSDSTNSDPRFLRAKMRQSLLPVLDQVFPRWKRHLCDLTQTPGDTIYLKGAADLIRSRGVKLRGNHWKELIRQGKSGSQASIDLPNGAKLTHNRKEGTWSFKPGKRK